MRDGESGAADPMTLVPGRPERVSSLAEQLASIAAGLSATASMMSRVGVSDWHGPAADALLGAVGVTPTPIRNGGKAFGLAAEAIRAHAQVLREAQAEARRAISLDADAAAATRAWQRAAAQHAAAARPSARGVAVVSRSARLPGRTALTPRGFDAGVDPGAAGRRAAEIRLAAARRSVTASAARVAAVLHEAAQSAPREPNLLQRLVARTQQYRRQVAFGLGESVVDLGLLLLKASPQRIVSDPAGWWRDATGTVAGFAKVFTDPVGFGKGLLDWNTWSRNPARAAGHLLPDVVAALATGGAVVAARGGRVAVDVARAARITTGGADVGAGSETAGRLARGAAGPPYVPDAGERAAGAARSMHRFPDGEPIASFASRVAPRPGVYDVAVHGTDSSVYLPASGGGQVAVNHRVLARLIRDRPEYAGEPVRLLSCQTGAREGGFAQNLANALGVQVEAPTDKLWISPAGEMTIGPYDFAGTGGWRTFVPGGQGR